MLESSQKDILLETMQSQLQISEGNAYRLFHGRGHCYPGMEALCVDYFAPILVVTFHREPPDEALEQWVEVIIDWGKQHIPEFSALVLQKRFVSGGSFEVIWGELPEKVYAQEAGLRYELAVKGVQNVGFFSDMRPARRWITQHAKGFKVLNLCSFTCALSVVAMDAGAAGVVNIDMNKRVLERGRRNHQINEVDLRGVKFLKHNIFQSWSKLRKMGPYDLVIIDPPTRQWGSFVAEKDYPRTVRRLESLVEPGGYILACLNAPHLGVAYLQEIFSEEAPLCEFIEALPPAQDHPEEDPDKGLKVLLYRMGEG